MMKFLDRGEVLDRVADVAVRTFNCPKQAISEATVAADIPGWDSLSHTIFIMGVEEAFAMEFETSEVFSFDNVGDLVSALAKRVLS